MDIGLKLKEIQVTPGSFDSIMHAATWFTTLRTRIFTARFEIYVDIELFSFGTKIDQLDVPRMFDIQRYFKEGFM
jgi:hypothetical protein